MLRTSRPPDPADFGVPSPVAQHFEHQWWLPEGSSSGEPFELKVGRHGSVWAYGWLGLDLDELREACRIRVFIEGESHGLLPNDVLLPGLPGLQGAVSLLPRGDRPVPPLEPLTDAIGRQVDSAFCLGLKQAVARDPRLYASVVRDWLENAPAALGTLQAGGRAEVWSLVKEHHQVRTSAGCQPVGDLLGRPDLFLLSTLTVPQFLEHGVHKGGVLVEVPTPLDRTALWRVGVEGQTSPPYVDNADRLQQGGRVRADSEDPLCQWFTEGLRGSEFCHKVSVVIEIDPDPARPPARLVPRHPWTQPLPDRPPLYRRRRKPQRPPDPLDDPLGAPALILNPAARLCRFAAGLPRGCPANRHIPRLVYGVAEMLARGNASSSLETFVWALVENLLHDMEGSRKQEEALGKELKEAATETEVAGELQAQLIATRAEADRHCARVELLEDVLAERLGS